MSGKFKRLVTPSHWQVHWLGWAAVISMTIALLSYSALKERDAGSPQFDTQLLSVAEAHEALANWKDLCPGADDCVTPGEYAVYALVWDTLFPIACAVFALMLLASGWRSFKLPLRVKRVEPLIWFSVLIVLTAAVGGDMSENIAATLIVTSISDANVVFTALVVGNTVKWVLWVVLSVFLVTAAARLIVINVAVLFHLRFPLLVLFAGMIASLAVPQVTELYTLADEKGQFVWLWLTSLTLAIAVWYTARTTLRYRLPTWHSPHTPLSSAYYAGELRLKIWVPRLLGTSVIAVVAVAFPGNSVILWFTAAMFATFVILRRRAFGADPLTVRRAREYLELEPWNLVAVSTGAKIALIAALIINLAIVVWTAMDPDFLRKAGAVSIILLAGTFFVITGSLLALLGSWLRIPFITVLIAGGSVMQWYGVTDNHFVRQCPDASSRSVGEAVCKRLSGPPPVADVAIAQRINAMRGKPVFIVSAAGGGIRAAAWTALVLGTIEDHAALSSHMFAGSGVSGGSLGLSVYAASVADGMADYSVTARQVLDRDFLSPALTAMFFNDSLQRIAPVGLPDRGEALERAWETAWKDATGSARLSEPFLQLYQAPVATRVPYLLLNTASVENGDRVVQHPWTSLPEGFFPGAADAAQLLLIQSETPPVASANAAYSNVPLSGIIHNSARFTYVSPAGSVLGSDGKVRAQWVDGGYFEASGAQSAFDVVEWLVQKYLVPRSDIHVIHIGNDIIERPTTEPIRPIGETMAPIQSILRSRSARGAAALEQLARSTPNFYHFCIAPGGHALPLGWTLSSKSFQEMEKQLDANAHTFRAVIGALGGKPMEFPLPAARPGACIL